MRLRKLFYALLLGASLLFAPAKVEAQSPSYGCCGFHDWATYGSNDLLRWHPSAHTMGGIGMDLFARGPWFSKSYNDKMWKRLVIVGILGSAWQANNLKEIEGYRWDYAVFDVSTNLVAAVVTELVFPVRKKQP